MSAPAAQQLDPSTIVSTNPGRNYEVVGEVRVSSAADIAVAVRQVRVGQPVWQALGVEGRVKALGPVVSLFEEPRQEIAEIIAREMRRRRMAPPAGCSITCAGGQPLERRARKPTALADPTTLDAARPEIGVG